MGPVHKILRRCFNVEYFKYKHCIIFNQYTSIWVGLSHKPLVVLHTGWPGKHDLVFLVPYKKWLVKCPVYTIALHCNVAYNVIFLEGTRTTRPCLSGHPVYKSHMFHLCGILAVYRINSILRETLASWRNTVAPWGGRAGGRDFGERGCGREGVWGHQITNGLIPKNDLIPSLALPHMPNMTHDHLF